MAPASCSTLSAHPRSVRIAGRLSFVISIDQLPPDESFRQPTRSGRLARSRDSQSAGLRFVPVFRSGVHNHLRAPARGASQCPCRLLGVAISTAEGVIALAGTSEVAG